jgi:hypothetical protein
MQRGISLPSDQHLTGCASFATGFLLPVTFALRHCNDEAAPARLAARFEIHSPRVIIVGTSPRFFMENWGMISERGIGHSIEYQIHLIAQLVKR